MVPGISGRVCGRADTGMNSWAWSEAERRRWRLDILGRKRKRDESPHSKRAQSGMPRDEAFVCAINLNSDLIHRFWGLGPREEITVALRLIFASGRLLKVKSRKEVRRTAQ